MQRFTAYRRAIGERTTHSAVHKNADDKPQFEGVIWEDGSCTLHWMTPRGAHSVWPSVEYALEIHGHPEYGTEIVWHDGPPHPFWVKMLAAVKGSS